MVLLFRNGSAFHRRRNFNILRKRIVGSELKRLREPILEKDSARKRVSPSDDSDEERSDDFDKEIFDE